MKAVAFAILLSAIACKEDKPAPPTTATTTTSETATESVANAAPSASAAHERHRSCPSRVHGATATASDVDGGVMITVSATDDATIAEIQSRASNLSAASSDTHRGRFCPEMHEDTTRTVTSTKTGAQITLAPSNAADLSKIRADVRDRLAHSEKRPD
jgi:hypothetical protein